MGNDQDSVVMLRLTGCLPLKCGALPLGTAVPPSFCPPWKRESSALYLFLFCFEAGSVSSHVNEATLKLTEIHLPVLSLVWH